MTARDSSSIASSSSRRVAVLEAEAVKLGTESQRRRFAEGLLPIDEIEAIARAELFRPFDGLRRAHIRDLKASNVRHEVTCPARRSEYVRFETRAAGELTHGEYEALLAVRDAAQIAGDHHWALRSARLAGVDDAITVEPLTHWATCRDCGAEACRSTARVTIRWAGRELVREYAL